MATQALLDAVSLARHVARAAPFGGRVPLRSALGEFEAEMSARAAPKARAAALGHFLQLTDVLWMSCL